MDQVYQKPVGLKLW